MRYDIISNKILIDPKQMAAVARRRTMPTPGFDEEESFVFDAPLSRVRETVGELNQEELSLSFYSGGHEFLLNAKVNIDFCDALCFAVSVEDHLKINSGVRALARAVAYLCAHMYFTKKEMDGGHISIFYVNSQNGEVKVENEYLKREATAKFFNKCKDTLGIYARPEIERVKYRLPYMKALKFPFKSFR